MSNLLTKDGELFNSQFERDLSDIINIHGVDNLVGVPDFILAGYLVLCLLNFDTSHSQVLRHTGHADTETVPHVG